MSIFKKPYLFETTNHLINLLSAAKKPLKGYLPIEVVYSGGSDEQYEVYGSYSLIKNDAGNVSAVFDPSEHEQYETTVIFSEADIANQALGTVLSRKRLD